MGLYGQCCPKEILPEQGGIYDTIVEFHRKRQAVKIRAILWTATMGYAGFILTGQGLRTFNNLSITEGLLGALTGFLLAVMFTLRERRRRRGGFITYSIDDILPWASPGNRRAK